MTSAIVDANIIIDSLRLYTPSQQWFAEMADELLGITPTVWMEVVGGSKSKSERERAVTFLRRFTIEHPTPEDNEWAMAQFARFYLSYGVEMQDVMIASVAVRLGVPLYTRNTKHYAALPGVIHAKPY